MKLHLLFVMLAATLVGCPECSEVVRSGPQIVLEEVASPAGYPIYRFEDQGRTCYTSTRGGLWCSEACSKEP